MFLLVPGTITKHSRPEFSARLANHAGRMDVVTWPLTIGHLSVAWLTVSL